MKVLGFDRFSGVIAGAVAALALIFAAGAPSAANALTSITWTLSGIALDDGGTLDGTFTVFSAGGYTGLSGFDLTTTGGSTLGGTHYTPAINAYLFNGYTLTVFNNASPAYDGFLHIQFANPLTGGTFDPIVGGASGPSYECGGWGIGPLSDCQATSPIRHIGELAGATSPGIPEPATWAMLLTGFMAVGLAARRRLRPAAAL